MERKQPRPLEIFFCYARKDRKLCKKLRRYLTGAITPDLIELWDDGDIIAGMNKEQTIKTHLETARIILLLISPDFLSDYCCRSQMAHALQRPQTQKVHVIPVLLRPVDLTNASFGILQRLPSNDRPITLWSNQDEALKDVVQGIRQVANELFSQPITTRDQPLPSNEVVLSPNHSASPPYPQPIPFPHRLDLSKRAALVLVGIVFILITGSVGLFSFISFIRSDQLATTQNITATSTSHVATTITQSNSTATTSSPNITPSTPQRTLQTLCNATKAEDYQTQWNQFDPGYASGNWNSESTYATDLMKRDKNHRGAKQCTVTNVMQNGSSANGTSTVTFNDGFVDSKTWGLKLEPSGAWRINASRD